MTAPDPLLKEPPVLIEQAPDPRLAVEEEARRQDAAEAARSSAAELWASSVARSPTGRAWARLTDRDFEPDASWEPTADDFAKLSEGIDDDLIDDFEHAVSAEHAQHIRTRLLEYSADRARLASGGFKGAAINIAVELTDPIAVGGTIAASYAAGPVGTGGAIASRTMRVLRALRSGSILAAPTVGIELGRYADSPDGQLMNVLAAGAEAFGGGAVTPFIGNFGRATRFGIGGAAGAVPSTMVLAAGGEASLTDLTIQGATSLVFGGLFNAIPGQPGGDDPVSMRLDRAGRRIVMDIEAAELAETGLPLTDKGRAIYRDQTPEAIQARQREVAEVEEAEFDADMDELAAGAEDWPTDGPSVGDDDIATIEARGTGLAPEGNVGPAIDIRRDKPLPPKQAGDFILDGVSDARTGGVLRMGVTEAVTDSPVPEVRRLARMLGRDPLPPSDGTAATYSASEWAENTTRADIAAERRASNAAYRLHLQHAKATGAPRLSRQEFEIAVAKTQRRAGYGGVTDPGIIAAAKATGEQYGQIHARANRHGVRQFDQFEHRPNYVSRLWTRPKIDAAIARHGYSQVRKLFIHASQLGRPDLPLKVHEARADVLMQDAGHKRPAPKLGELDPVDAKEYIAELKARYPSIDDEYLELVAESIGVVPDPKTQVPTRARARIDIDETAQIDLIDDAGMTYGRLGIEDLIENDSGAIFAAYARQINGASALSEVYRAFGDPGEELASVPALLAKVVAKATQQGLTPRQIKADLKRIDYMARLAGGLPRNEDTGWRAASRSMRNLQYMRLMSGLASGVRNMAELAHAVSTVGLKATLRQFPALTTLIKRAEDGTLTNALGREIEAIGIGVERMVYRPAGVVHTAEGGVTRQSRIERLTHRGARFAGDVSLQNPTQLVMSRWTGRLVAQKLATDLFNITPSRPKMNQYRQRAMGLEDSMIARIKEQMQHVRMRRTAFGPVLEEFNFHRWSDPEAASHVMQAIAKTTNRLIMSPSGEQLPLWFSSEMGGLIGQLRQWTVASWRSKLLFELKAADVIAARNVVLASFATIPAYVAGVWIDSLGRGDAEAYRRKRLDPDQIAKAVVARNTFSSLLPMAVDVGAEAAGEPPVFGFSRASGLPGYGLVSGVPTVDWGIAVWQALQSVTDNDEGVNMRQINSALFIPRLPGLRQSLERLAQ